MKLTIVTDDRDAMLVAISIVEDQLRNTNETDGDISIEEPQVDIDGDSASFDGESFIEVDIGSWKLEG